MIKELTSELFLSMLTNGKNALKKEKDEINELNVFPVPDGDTGDNMYMTLKSGVESLNSALEMDQMLASLQSGVLRGARGNSGVILSIFLSGICEKLSGNLSITTEIFSEAFSYGVEKAYSSIANPVEGTILTVAKAGATCFDKQKNFEDFLECFEKTVYEMTLAVERTPEQMPLLKEAGVVDSGGRGLVVIFDGMVKAMKGEKIEDHGMSSEKTHELDFSLFNEDSELLYGYCTEFLLQLQTCKGRIEDFSLESFKEFLMTHGDSVVCFLDGSIVKVHVHTKNPGEILDFAENFGEFLTCKIENMTLQHDDTVKEKKKNKPHKKMALAACSSGAGMRETLLEMGCDAIVPYSAGETEVARILNECNADSVLFLSHDTYTEIPAKIPVYSVKTKSALTTIYLFSMMDAGMSPEENQTSMQELSDFTDVLVVKKDSDGFFLENEDSKVFGTTLSELLEKAKEICDFSMADMAICLASNPQIHTESEAFITGKNPMIEVVMKDGYQQDSVLEMILA